MDPALRTQLMAQAMLAILNAFPDLGPACFDGRDGRMTEAEVRAHALRVLDGSPIGDIIVIDERCQCAECQANGQQDVFARRGS